MNTYQLECGHLAVSDAQNLDVTGLTCPVCNVPKPVAEQMNKTPAQPSGNGGAPPRSYGCSFGCGNPYDYVFVSVSDGTTEFLCMPCFVKLASDIVEAATSTDGTKWMQELAEIGGGNQAPVNGPAPKRRGKNAPADTDDPDLIEAFDSRITVDELGDEFT